MEIKDAVQQVAKRYEANIALAAGLDDPQQPAVPLIIKLADAYAEAKRLLDELPTMVPKLDGLAGASGGSVPEGGPLQATTPELQYVRLVESNYVVVEEALETMGDAVASYRTIWCLMQQTRPAHASC